MTPQQQIADYFPVPPARTPDTPVYIFGCQILAYILSTDVEVYGLLSDRDLADAHYAARYALMAPEILPLAVEKITQVQLTIGRVLTCRAAEPQQPPAAEPHDHPHDNRPPAETRPPGGSRVPTHPTPPKSPMPDALRLPVVDFQF